MPGPVSSSFQYLWTLMIFIFFNTPTHKSGKQCTTNSLYIGSCFGIRLREDRVLAQWRAACGCPISDEVRCPVRRMTAAAFEIFQIYPSSFARQFLQIA